MFLFFVALHAFKFRDMKRILSLALAAFLLIPALSGQGKRFQVAGVAFYNLENLFDTINNNSTYDLEYSPKGSRKWDGRKYWSKIHNMAYAISQLKTDITPAGPAVIGVSEIENRSVLEDLVKDEQIKASNYQIVHHNSPDRRGVDVALLYNPRMFRVLNATHHTLTIPDYPTFRTRDQTCVSGLLFGEHVSIIVNHWPSRIGGQQQSSYLREAAAALSKHIADSVLRVNPNQKIIIMGDLNDDPSDKSCAEVIGAKKKMKDVEKDGWFNPWWEVLDKGIGTLAYKGQWNLFDQIIINGNMTGDDRSTLKYFKCKVHNDIPGLKETEGDRKGYPRRTFASGIYLNGYSDHYPTQIFLVREIKNK